MPIGIEWPDSALAWVWRASLQAFALGMMVLLVQWLFGRWLSARWRFALWWVVVIRLVTPFWLDTPVGVFNMGESGGRSSDVPATIQEQAAGQGTTTSVNSEGESSLSRAQQEREKDTPASSPARMAWSKLAIWGWFGGSILCAAYVAAVSWRQRRRIQVMPKVTDKRLLGLMRECHQRAGLPRRELTMRYSREGSMPALYGLRRPCLLLPRDLGRELSRDQLRHIFLHELAHLKRWDLGSSWLITGAVILHWFNPLAWWLSRRMQFDCELACDELTLSFLGENENQSYGSTIVTLLERAASSRPLPGLMGIVETNKPLKTRIRMIANFKERNHYSFITIVTVGVLGIVALTDSSTSGATASETSDRVTPEKGRGGGHAANGRHDADTHREQVLLDARFVSVDRSHAKAMGLERVFPTREEGADRPHGVGEVGSVSLILSPDEREKILSVADERDGIRLLGAPRISTLSSREASIRSGKPRDVVTEVETEAKRVGVRPRDVSFESAVTVLPYVFQDGLSVQLTVDARVRSFDGYEDVGIGETEDGVTYKGANPIELRRHVRSQAILYDGQTLLVSGGSSGVADPGASGTKPDERVLLLFLSPRIIDAAGNSVHSQEELKAYVDSIPPQARAIPIANRREEDRE